MHAAHENPFGEHTLNSQWNHLQVVATVNTTLLFEALDMICTAQAYGNPEKSHRIRPHMLETSWRLLRLGNSLSHKSINAEDRSAWVIVEAFLWTHWQRMMMLALWHRLDMQLHFGYDYDSSSDIEGLGSIPDLYAHQTQVHSEELRMTPYMCSWAYELLRNDRASTATDLRHFHSCYNRLFSGRPARCKTNQQQCEGGSPKNCQRFKGAVIEDQSAHNAKCDGKCKRLFWDRDSFVGVQGAKAVCIVDSNDRYLRYRTASKRTLAVSHVWSHGQGGRPETGLNACLHQRYARLALRFDCDSYWMDTPCIPSEETIRTECINNINMIFADSMITLVCDQDIMNIDISNLTVDLRESILAAVLVSDWNLRAWTLLEAMRGRAHIHLLCKDDRTLNYQESLKLVHRDGRIDIAILALSAQHLLPHTQRDELDLSDHPNLDEPTIAELGLVSLSEASILLSHRHATRDGDDIVIWSLLANENAIHDVSALWKSQIGSQVQTGSLMSSLPRIQSHKGFGWAPICPTIHSRSSFETHQGIFYPAYDGLNSGIGAITSEGLQAKWLIHKFSLHSATSELRFPKNVAIARQWLHEYPLGAFVRPSRRPGPRYQPAPYQGRAKEALLAVCGSRDGLRWEWKNIYEWDDDDPEPIIYLYKRKGAPPNDFILEDVLLV